MERLFKEKPNDIVNEYLSIAYLSTGRFEAYKNECKELLNRLKLESTDDQILTVLRICSLYPDALSDFAPLIQHARRLVQKNPRNQKCLLRLGSILLRAGKYQEAQTEFEKGLLIPFLQDGSAVPYLYLFALLKKYLGEHDNAVKQFNEAEKHAQLELGRYPKWNQKLANQLLGEETKEIVMASK